MSYVSDYNRERDRLRKQLARMAKRGYVFAQEIMPPRPKRITAASVRRLQRLTTEFLYKQALYVDPTTGEALPGLQGRKLEARRRAQRSAETRRQRQQPKIPQTEEEAPVSDYEGPIGTYDVLAAITEALQKLPQRNYFYGYAVDTSGDRSAVLNLWDQMLNPTLPEGVTMEEYRKRLAGLMESRSAEIKELITALTYDSQSPLYYFHLRRLIDLLTPGITLDAKTLQDIGNQLWEYEIEEGDYEQ